MEEVACAGFRGGSIREKPGCGPEDVALVFLMGWGYGVGNSRGQGGPGWESEPLASGIQRKGQ